MKKRTRRMKSKLEQCLQTLEGIGIWCAEDFTCCCTCAHSAMQPSPTDWGFCYYHEQDTDGALASDSDSDRDSKDCQEYQLSLRFGATDDNGNDEDNRQVGAVIARVLAKQGRFPVKWNGTANQVVSISLGHDQASVQHLRDLVAKRITSEPTSMPTLATATASEEAEPTPDA